MFVLIIACILASIDSCICQQQNPIGFIPNLTDGLPWLLLIIIFALNFGTPLLKWIYVNVIMVRHSKYMRILSNSMNIIEIVFGCADASNEGERKSQ